MDKKKKRIAQWLPLLFAALFLPLAAACDKDSEKEKEPPAPPVELGAEVLGFEYSIQEINKNPALPATCTVDYDAENRKLTVALTNLDKRYPSIKDIFYKSQPDGNILKIRPFILCDGKGGWTDVRLTCSWEFKILNPGEYALYLGDFIAYTDDSGINPDNIDLFKIMLPLKLDLTKDLHFEITQRLNWVEYFFDYEIF